MNAPDVRMDATMNPRPSRRIADDQTSRSPLEVTVPASAWDRFLAALKSEPLSQQELVDLYGVGRNKIAAILRNTAGAERMPGGWRVPLSKLPPAYFIAAGLMPQRDA